MSNFIIDSLNIPGTSDVASLTTPYGTCSTAAATAAKVVTCPNFVALDAGAKITVKFSNTNSVANPTLNVNNTGAKTITCHGVALTGQNVNFWRANEMMTFTYDGSAWCIDGMRCPDDFADILARNDAMLYKGTIAGSSTAGTVSMLPTTANAGWTYKVATAGYIGSKYCQVGDMIVCNADTSAGQTTVSSTDKTAKFWDILQTNVDITTAVTDTDAKVPTAGAVVDYAAKKDHKHNYSGNTGSNKTGVTVTSTDAGHTHTFSANLASGTAASAGAHTHTVTPTGTVTSTDAGHSHAYEVSLTDGKAESAGTHTHTLTAKGTVTIVEPTAEDESKGHAHTASSTFSGTAAAQKFTGSAVNSGAPSATVTVAAQAHTHSYTPAGSVSSHKHTIGAAGTTTIKQVSSVGTLPSLTAPSLTMAATNRRLTVTFSAGSLNAGTLPTTSNVSVVTSIPTETANTQPTFTGTAATIAKTGTTGTSVATGDHTHSVTAAGTNGSSTVTGTVTTTVDKAQTGVTATFKGSSATTSSAGSHSHTVTGLVSGDTDDAVAVITSTFAGNNNTTSNTGAHTHTVSGSVSGTSGSGKASITSTVTDNGHTHSYTGSTSEPV